MENTGLFPNMVNQMIAVGEESGSLDEMSGKVATFYEAEVDNAVEAGSIGDGELNRDAVAAPALVEVVDEGGEAIAAAGLGVCLAECGCLKSCETHHQCVTTPCG